MSDGAKFLRRLNMEAGRRPVAAAAVALTWLGMMLSLLSDGLFFCILYVLLYVILDIAAVSLSGDRKPALPDVGRFAAVSLLGLPWRTLPVMLHLLGQVSVPVMVQNTIFMYRRPVVFAAVCCFLLSVWLFSRLCMDAAGAFFSKKIKEKHVFLRILLLEGEFILLFVLLIAAAYVLLSHLHGGVLKIAEAAVLLLEWLLFVLFQLSGLQLYCGGEAERDAPAKCSALVAAVFLVAALAQCLFISRELVPNVRSSFSVISHRGSDGNNGVPNTVPTLKATKKSLAPDYSELDVRQTADGRFLVTHDERVGARGREVSSLSLGDLIEFRIRDYGHSAYLSGYSQYLDEAHRLGQPLLTEIKTGSDDSYDLPQEFCHLYADSMVSHGDMIHSMDCRVLYGIRKADSRIKLGYVMPFELFSLPSGPMDFLSAELLTLNRTFIGDAHAEGRKVYVWTVNDRLSCICARAMGADGIITDNGSRLGSVLRNMTEDELSLGCFINGYFNLR